MYIILRCPQSTWVFYAIWMRKFEAKWNISNARDNAGRNRWAFHAWVRPVYGSFPHRHTKTSYKELLDDEVGESTTGISED